MIISKLLTMLEHSVQGGQRCFCATQSTHFCCQIFLPSWAQGFRVLHCLSMPPQARFAGILLLGFIPQILGL